MTDFNCCGLGWEIKRLKLTTCLNTCIYKTTQMCLYTPPIMRFSWLVRESVGQMLSGKQLGKHAWWIILVLYLLHIQLLQKVEISFNYGLFDRFLIGATISHGLITWHITTVGTVTWVCNKSRYQTPPVSRQKCDYNRLISWYNLTLTLNWYPLNKTDL